MVLKGYADTSLFENGFPLAGVNQSEIYTASTYFPIAVSGWIFRWIFRAVVAGLIDVFNLWW